MKIIELIKIIELSKDYDTPIILMNPGQHDESELSIYSTSQGVCFYKDQDIWFLSISDADKAYDIKTLIEKNIREVYDNVRELNRYLAVSELLRAINIFNGGQGIIDFEKAKVYVNRINQQIGRSLDFHEIIKMENLIDLIKKDKLFRELFFSVNEVCCNRDERYRGYKKQENKYCFGNKKYHEDLDIVDITVYDDCVELLHRGEGRSHERDLDRRRPHTLEQKIISALDCWKCAFWN